MAKYGLPYQGCKDRIAEAIVDKFPRASHFYDLFCGGGSMTHCAMLSGKFKKFHMNDLRQGLAQTFMDVCQGKRHDALTHWVSREEYKASYKTDWLTALCWSFGNKGDSSYLYAKEIEPWKKALHYWVCFNDPSIMQSYGLDAPELTAPTVHGRRMQMRKWVQANKEECKAKYIDWYKRGYGLSSLESLERLERLERLEAIPSLESLERLERLEKISSLERLEATSLDYRQVKIESDSVIYCDIPYRGTAGYAKTENFDHEAFYDWAESFNGCPDVHIFISEYSMP